MVPIWKMSLMQLLLLCLWQMQLSAAAIASQSSAQQASVDAKTYASTASNTKVLDRFNYRYPDGSYEYRFELSDGTARYERGYFALIDNVKTLMVVGYYSYRMPDNRYITVFYNADQFGYRQNQSITPQVYPNLPRSIEVPGANETSKRQQPQQQYQQHQQHQPHQQQFGSYASSTPKAFYSATSPSYLSSSAAQPTHKGRF